MHYKQLKRVLSTLALGLICLVASAQHTVSGVVKDSQGAPLPGVSVIVEGTTQGTVTDFDGNYTIANVPESANLQASFIGFTTQVIAVGNQTTIDFTLKDETQELGEVVAVGYGTMKKTDITGSIASVSTEQLVSKGATTVLESLQGSVPGVSITQNSGRTNGGFGIEIRGKSSLTSSTTPIFVIDGVVYSDMDFLNPQDIERIDVLKDASSTAIYGSRATAGVVMVTTKSGSAVNKNKNEECKQKFNVTYDGYFGTSKVVRKADFQDASEFTQYRFFRFLDYASKGARPTYRLNRAKYQQAMLYDYTDGGESVLRRLLSEGKTYDWVDLVTQTGQKQNHYVAFNGSTSDISYYMGVGVTNEEGVYKGDKMRRYNFKGSLDSDMNKHLSAGFSVNAIVTNNSYAYDDAIQEAFRANPFARPYDDEGNLIMYPINKNALGTDQPGMTEYQFSDQVNPLYKMSKRTKERETYRLLGNAYVQVKPIDGLSIKTTYSPNFTYYRDGTFQDIVKDGDNTTATWINQRSWGYTWTNIANFNKKFADVHAVDVTAVAELMHSTTEKIQAQFTDPLENSYWYNIGSGEYVATNTSNGTSYSENSMLSYVFRANYVYDNKYMFTGTLRWDGNSKFEEGHKWGSFPSLALAWRLSEEGFMENTREVLSNLKLRLAYGMTGNCSGVSNFCTQQTVGGPVYQAFGTSTSSGFYPSSIVNKDISWESSKEFNVGVDFGFLDNRISGTIDIYQKKSYDLLWGVMLPLESGGGRMETNVGGVQNNGIELALTGVIIDNEDWRWEVSATFAKNKNKVNEINGTGNDLPSDGFFIGMPVNNIYTYSWDGIVNDKNMTVPDTEAARNAGLTPGSTMKSYDYYYAVYGWNEGMPIIRDANGDGKFDADDKEIRSSDPKWIGSLSTILSWKGIDFSASLYTKQGYEVSSATYSQYLDYGDRGRVRLNADYYIPAGTLISVDDINADGTYVNPIYQTKTHYGKYPFPNAGEANSGAGAYWSSVRSTVDASYVKIKNMTLGYSLPKNVLDVIHLQKARVYCTVTNPFCWAKDDFMGWDPEWANASLKNDGPATITWEFGLNLKF